MTAQALASEPHQFEKTHLLSTAHPEVRVNTKQAWQVCLAAGLFFLFEYLQVSIFNALDPQLLKEFQVSAARLGSLSAHYFYANVLFLFPAGLILDRISTRKAIIWSMGWCVLATYGFAFSPTIAWADIFRFITGIGGAFCLLSAVRLATRWFPAKRLAMVIGVIVSMAFVGGMIAQTPMTLLVDYLGWRAGLAIDATIGVMFWLLIMRVVKDYPEGSESFFAEQHKKLKAIGFWTSTVQAAKSLQTWLAGFYTSFMNLAVFLLGAMWGGLYLVQVHGLSRNEGSVVTMMIYIGTLLGSTIIGWYSDRIASRKKPMILFCLLSLATILAVMFLPSLGFFSLIILFLLLGFFTSAQIISYPLIAESNPRILTGAAEGIASVVIMSGGFLQPLFGYFMEMGWDHKYVNGIPFYSAHNYMVAVAMIPAGLVLALISVFFIRETHCKALDE